MTRLAFALIPKQSFVNSMIQSLTSFRFITALVVFLFHCQMHLGWRVEIAFIDNFLINGATFMTGFFVLSGFVMAHVYGNTDFTQREKIFDFYTRRFAKIYPTYMVVTILYFSFSESFTSTQITRSLINGLFLFQGFFPSLFNVGINGATWSLSVEMFLYFLFPFLMLLSVKSPKILIVAIIFALIVSVNSYMDQSDPIYGNPVMRLADFMCGIGFYFLKEKLKHMKYFGIWHVVTVIVLLYACTISGKDYNYMLGQFMIVPLFGFWIVMTYYSKSLFYNNKIMEYLGLISYSFYLWQFAAIELGKKLLKEYPDINIHLIFFFSFMTNVIISMLSYHLVEERARKLIIAKYSAKRSFKVVQTIN